MRPIPGSVPVEAHLGPGLLFMQNRPIIKKRSLLKRLESHKNQLELGRRV